MSASSIDGCFIPRPDITSILHKRMDAFQRGYRQNVGLVGRQYLGKSAILREFLADFSYPDIIPIYIEMASEPFDYFVKKCMGTMLQSYMRASNITIPIHFDGLVKRTRKFIPDTLKRMRTVKQAVAKGDTERAFDELLMLTDVLGEETGRKVLLILDEFHRLEQFGMEDPFARLGRAIMVQKNTMYVVASSEPEHAAHIFREKLSLLFGNFESIEVRPFNFEESVQCIETILRPLTLVRSLVHLLIQLTDGHPYYLNIISQTLKRHATPQANSLAEHAIIDILTELLYHPTGQLHQHFLLKLHHFNKGCQYYFYLNILLAVACGIKKMNAIARFIEKDKEETKKGLQRLVDEDLIERSGYFYFLNDSLLRFWLKYVLHKRFMTLGVAALDNEAVFRRDVADLIDSACHEEHKELSKRVEELLRSFRNDVIEINHMRMKCPNFNEVYLRPTNGRIFPLYAKAPNTRWLCQVVDKHVEEEEVQALVDDSKKMRKKIHRRILITPYGITLNAKLMAKQEKIAIWNLRNLNFVFDLYDKPKVIV